MTRLDISAAPVPCPDAVHDEAPTHYIDADGALHIWNGIASLCLEPSGKFEIWSHFSHRVLWDPATCTPATSGVTLTPHAPAEGPHDIIAAARADMIARLDRLPPSAWRDAVAQEVIEAGGIFPLAHDAEHDQPAGISLHGITTYGVSVDATIANWIAAARLGLSATCGALTPERTRP